MAASTKSGRRWTEQETGELRQLAPEMTLAELARHFRRTENAVWYKCQQQEVEFKRRQARGHQNDPAQPMQYDGVMLNVPRRVVNYWMQTLPRREVKRLLSGKVVVEG